MDLNIKKITIKNLFQKDNYVIPIADNRIMIISENGAGKTTILRMIYLFLAGEWEKLILYEFESISIEYDENQFIEYKREVFSTDKIVSTFKSLTQTIEFREEIESIINQYQIDELLERIEQNTHQETINTILTSLKSMEDSNKLNNEEDDFSDEEDIIEEDDEDMDLDDFTEVDWIESRSDHIAEILPGVISILWRELYKDSYQKINLFDNVLYLPTYRKIEVSENSLFASKGKKKLGFSNRGHFLFEFGMMDIERKLSEDGINSEKIDDLISVCNDYLYEKEILIENNRLVVAFIDSEERYNLERLSSGEKQLITLFGYVYLSESKYIIIYDEPEISFSIEWQRRLLPDLLSSDNVSLLLSSTHSPFLSDNEEMDPYVVALNELWIEEL